MRENAAAADELLLARGALLEVRRPADKVLSFDNHVQAASWACTAFVPRPGRDCTLIASVSAADAALAGHITGFSRPGVRDHVALALPW